MSRAPARAGASVTDRVQALERLEERVVNCFACPRLVEWRELVAREKRASFASEEYWGRPIAGMGDPDARVYVLGLVLFAALGTVVGIFAETFDHHTFVANVVILPLAFVGGVFYSVDSLGSPWQELSHVNPVFYLVNAIRYGFLGTSDVSVWLSLGVTAALAIPVYLWSQYLFTSGRRLKA